MALWARHDPGATLHLNFHLKFDQGSWQQANQLTDTFSLLNTVEAAVIALIALEFPGQSRWHPYFQTP